MTAVVSRTSSLFRKLIKSIVLITYLALAACGGDNSTSLDHSNTSQKQISHDMAEIELPNPVSISNFNTPGELKAYVKIDDGERKEMELGGENALLNIEGISTGEHQINLEFEYYSDSFGTVAVATLTKPFEISKGKNWLTVSQEEYQIDELDDDKDGVSNLYELTNTLQPSNPKLANNFPPEFSSSTALSLPENSVGPLNIVATDANGHSLSYRLVGGADANLFNIESDSGLLRFLAPPNFESPTDNDANNIYEVEIKVTDELGASTNQLVLIEVINESPEHEPQSLSLAEDPPTQMIENDQVQLSVVATGTGAISFSSSNDEVLYVSNNGLLVATLPGTAIISVSIEADDLYQSANMSFTVEVLPDSFTLYGWIGKNGSDLVFPAEMVGVEFYRSIDENCDLTDYQNCAQGSLDILNEPEFIDDTARLNQVAYYTFVKDNVSASGEFGGRLTVSRTGHQVVPYQDKLWLIGGYGRAGYKNDIWSTTDGIFWSKENAAAEFSARAGHQIVIFQNKLWLIAGGKNGSLKNDVWSSQDGVHWELETDSAEFAPRTEHQVVVYQNQLWLIGGAGESGKYNDVWRSSDGVQWTEVTPSAQFSSRKGHQVVVFQNQLLLIGGEGFAASLNDVWSSSDGETWVESETSSPITPKADHQVLVVENKLWLLGGSASTSIWSSLDGVTWKREGAQEFLSHRYNFQLVAFKNRLWVIGGKYFNSRYFNDVWSSSNGITWREENAELPFSGRSGHQVVNFRNRLWIIGGDGEDLKNDIWSSSDGLVWEQEVDEAPFSARRNHQVVEFNGKLFLMAGYALGDTNDIWSSTDGINWLEETSSAAFPKTSELKVVQFKNQLWLAASIKGESSSYTREIWNSDDGVNWQLVDASTTLPSDKDFDLITFANKLWLSHGDSIWSSEDGVNWELAAYYSQNRKHQLVTYNDKLFLIAEAYFTEPMKEVWASSDGVNWNKVTTEADYSTRSGFQVVEFQNQLMLIGGYDGDYSSEVWKSSDGVNWSLGVNRSFLVK